MATTEIVYSTVERKVKKIAKQLGVNYMFMNWAQANVEFDHVDGPTIVYILPPSGELDFHNMSVKDYPQSQIAFLDSTEFDFDGDKNDNVVERMKRLCIKFIAALNRSGMFEEIEGRISYRVLYDHLDQNVTGVVITPQLIEEEGVFLCEESYRSDDDIKSGKFNVGFNIKFPDMSIFEDDE